MGYGSSAVVGAAGIGHTVKGAQGEEAGKNNTAAEGGGEPLPDPRNPRDPRSPGAPLFPGDAWYFSPWAAWTYQHISEMRPTAPISRGPGPVQPLPQSLQPIGDIKVKFEDGEGTVNDFLGESFTDGFLVLHRGQIVFERYMNNLAPHRQHLWMSSTKALIAMLTGIVVNKGLVEVTKPVTHYLPELEATAYKGATVQHLLDMSSGVVYDDDYDPLWRDSVFSQPDGPRTMWELALTMDKAERPHGAAYKYKSSDVDVLGFILQRVSGMYLADLISQEIWAPMGAEQDAYMVVDKTGFGLADGGLCTTLRDFGRFAQLIVDGGAREGRQIIPQSWIDETLGGRGAPGSNYHNQWEIDPDGRGMGKGGQGGQYVYVEPAAEFAAVKFSHFTLPYREEDRTAGPYQEVERKVNPRTGGLRPALDAIRAALS
ncbi:MULTISPECIES: serine hydrolase [unclassified Mesorhizobium]|uniref:serine hydrolase domain-containing protein n=1 Tax=unclassified Mesorhizobium TaxID=325217 RepID=UPI00167A28BF|nr:MULTISPECIES: serine hydrolase [unclassified Mesorhizobium]